MDKSDFVLENKKELEELVLSETVNESDNLYLVLQTEIYFDEIRHEIIAFWENKDDALKDAENQIKNFTKDKYYRAGDSFYGDADDVVCVISVGEKTLKKDENVTQVL